MPFSVGFSPIMLLLPVQMLLLPELLELLLLKIRFSWLVLIIFLLLVVGIAMFYFMHMQNWA